MLYIFSPVPPSSPQGGSHLLNSCLVTAITQKKKEKPNKNKIRKEEDKKIMIWGMD